MLRIAAEVEGSLMFVRYDLVGHPDMFRTVICWKFSHGLHRAKPTMTDFCLRAGMGRVTDRGPDPGEKALHRVIRISTYRPASRIF
jgi:hypothetical protein